MGKQVIKIGTKIAYQEYDGTEKIASVKSIERCSINDKYGSMVDAVSFDEKNPNYASGVKYIFNLDNDKWCDGEQIKRIVEERYIVVAFYQGAGFTLQTDNELHFFFHNPALAYKVLGRAQRKARQILHTRTCEKVCVFRVELGETLSGFNYDDWCKPESGRLYFEEKWNH